MDIGGAVAALRGGMRVARAGWNGRGMWLVLIPRQPLGPEFGERAILEHVQMRTVQGDMVPWLCSQTDLLAEDWDWVR